ncbi:cell wall protein DAN4 [Solanum lycopersicum]|uniref:Calmodulin-binding domain-containing protein n=1 Tax=Solanum lycopersicum TaxID=4081 RepID=A0A3Q7HSC6_SOLLC|nr:RNA polymerase II degradation factor 1-like [Solanum lycopersicum]
MATRAREPAPAGKEKRGTSPIHHQRSTTNTSKTTSTVRKQTDPTLTTSSLNKNVPSYLKPTITQAKKSASSGDLHNTHSTKTSNLARRRSFDNNPPLHSSSPKTRISPSPKERIPRSSSSLSTKTSTSQKPLLDRLSKTTTSKDAIGKQRSAGLNSRPVTKRKTTTTTTRKHDSASGSTTKASVTANSPDIAQNVISHEGEQSEPEDHQELTTHETEKETTISDNEMIADSDAGEHENDNENENDSATEDHIEELSNENVNSAELKDINAPDDSATLVENPETKIEEPEEINNEPNEPDLSEKEKEETVINATEENQESKEEDEETNQEKETPIVEETESLSSKQVEVGVEETTEAEPVKNTNVASSKSLHHVVQGKNNESVVSNNVIEETATKLREQRKNKVRALAGAFETVISRQDHK